MKFLLPGILTLAFMGLLTQVSYTSTYDRMPESIDVPSEEMRGDVQPPENVEVSDYMEADTDSDFNEMVEADASFEESELNILLNELMTDD